MAKEIERKFLVKDNSFDLMTTRRIVIRQAYLSDKVEATVRVRIFDGHGYLTVKGKNDGAVRDEWEYEIPVSDAEEMAQRLAGGWSIDKVRHIVPYGGFVWEVDVFNGKHSGLILAEVELPSIDSEVTLPPFVSTEVTGDPAYYNSTLAKQTSSDTV